MSRSRYSVNYRITHIDIRTCHIDFGTKNLFAVFKLAVFHFFEKSQIFFYASVSRRTFLTGLRKSSSVFSYLFCAHIADISKTFFNKKNGGFVHSIEVVGSVKFSVPFKAEPFDIFLYAFNILFVFFYRISVVETEIAFAFIFIFHTEIYAKGFCVPYMKKTVRFRRKTGYYFFTVLFDIFIYYLFYKIEFFFHNPSRIIIFAETVI